MQTDSSTFQQERRAHPRITPDEKVVVRIDWSEGELSRIGNPINASGIDLSSGGIQVSLNFSIPIGFALKLLIDLPERNEQFKASGTVAWSGIVENTPEYRMGINFSEFSSGDFAKWNLLLPI